MKAEESPIKIREIISKYCDKLNIQKLNIDEQKKKYIAAIGAAILLSVIILMYTYHNMAYIVKVDGKEVGTVRGKEDFTRIVEKVTKDLHKEYNTEVVFRGKVFYERIKAKDQVLTKEGLLEETLKKGTNFKVKAYGIQANSKVVATVTSKEDTNKVLEAVKKIYIDEETKFEKVDFAEDISVEPLEAEAKKVKKVEDAVNLILKGTEEEQIHKIQKGESFWTISRKYKLTVDDLIKANPKINPEKLQIDQEISLVVPIPLLTVETVEKAKFEEIIPFEIEYEETSDLFKGEKRVKLKGKDGKRVIVAELIKHNGKEFSKNVLEENIVEEPKKQIVLKGTKNPPPKKGTGSLMNPTRGRLSSRFGWRWGRRHTGIDIAARTGTTVKAADGGVVAFAGYRNGYGKCIILDHGANTQTYYAHNSKLIVKKGQRIYKGQKIAEVGNTGRSTGPHLHFEVRKNGVPTNPLKYVRY